VGRGGWIPGLPGGDDGVQVPQDRAAMMVCAWVGVSLFSFLLVRCW
jgi:hypothetical protein